MGDAKIANLSGEFFAIVLGVISPNINITIVSDTVDTVAAVSALEPVRSPVKKSVPRDAAAMFTMLFPIRIVEMSES